MTTKKRVNVGDRVRPFTLPAIDGSSFALDAMRGRRYMLSFFRFAACPFCNMRLHELVTRFGELGDAFGIVAIFDSPLNNLRQHAERHQAPFPILADEENRVYRSYAIEHSVAGMLKGIVTRMPTLMRGMAKGYLPTTIKGRVTTMPADFLVDEEGIIQFAHYGRDEGDHLPFDVVRAFALGGKGDAPFDGSVAG